MNSEVRGVKSPAHVKHRLEDLYWCVSYVLLDRCLTLIFLNRNHWSLYPVCFQGRDLPSDTYDELMGILTHGCIDVMTSRSSTFPYDVDTMYKMIKLAQNAKKANGGEAYYTAGATRLLSFFAHWRFLYFHGQRHARLVRDETVYEKPKRERSMFITLLSPLLFLAPEVHLREVEKLWTDEVVIETVWKSFMTKLLKEWDDLILWSTVMLTANVGFLAIPGVILSNLSGSPLTSASDVVIFTSSTQIASCVSIEASIASIVVALLLATYLFKNTHKTFGFEPMAIIFSLPWALLMWSMVVFFIALLLLCFTISNMATRIFVGFISVLMASLIVWCIQSTWESGHDEYARVWRDSLAAMRRTHRNVIGYMKQLRAGALIPFPTRRTPEDVHNLHPMDEVAGV
ncbi:hypothetical protein BC826DRAFT_934163 [Russula brevipes]|nr:hypothetical protein BC826DRAFT_934163 [Russula brevipes]